MSDQGVSIKRAVMLGWILTGLIVIRGVIAITLLLVYEKGTPFLPYAIGSVLRSLVFIAGLLSLFTIFLQRRQKWAAWGLAVFGLFIWLASLLAISYLFEDRQWNFSTIFSGVLILLYPILIWHLIRGRNGYAKKVVGQGFEPIMKR